MLGLLTAPTLFAGDYTTSQYTTSSYTISYVYDGDTVKVRPLQNDPDNILENKQEFKLRITDIDAPERNQPYGKKSRRALSQLCKGPEVEIEIQLTGIDKYQRQLGKLQCNHTDASLYLVQQGLAWHNTKYSNDAGLKAAAQKSKANRIGLWSDQNPLPPWVWRQLHSQPKNPPASIN